VVNNPRPTGAVLPAATNTAGQTNTTSESSRERAAPAALVDRPPVQLATSAVSYEVVPPQVYPDASRRLGESGQVMLRVLVDEHGLATEVHVARSSGFNRLDQAAVRAIREARFRPYAEAGVARPFWVNTPFAFNLDD
jgi:protein TonB